MIDRVELIDLPCTIEFRLFYKYRTGRAYLPSNPVPSLGNNWVKRYHRFNFAINQVTEYQTLFLVSIFGLRKSNEITVKICNLQCDRLNRWTVSFQRDSFDEEPTKEEKRIASNFVQLPRFGLAVNVAHRNGDEDLTEQDSKTVVDIAVDKAMPMLAIDPVLIPQDAESTISEAPLTDREKRCLAVPIGDLHDKKRKLLRTRSIPSRSMWVRAYY